MTRPLSQRPLVSIVMATYERGELLRRSLVGYETSVGLDVRSDLELVVIDDGSTDGTAAIVREWSHRTGIVAVVLTPHPKREGWRDCGAVLNYGIRASLGKHVILTHPECIPGRGSVAACVKELERYDSGRDTFSKLLPNTELRPGLYACCRVYYLSPQDQVRIDTVPWAEEGALAVRQIEGFYEDDTNGHPDYSHRATDIVAQPRSRITGWESWVFGGLSRETWKRLGGMLETQKWGSVDIAFMSRRRALGIPNHTCPADDTIVIHQNHSLPGMVDTPRDMEVWVKELKDVDLVTPSKLTYPYIDYI